MPERCPICGKPVSKDGSWYYCTDDECEYVWDGGLISKLAAENRELQDKCSEWISIKDTFKLPEIEKTILVYSERTGYVLGRFSHYREFIADDGCPMSISYLFDINAYWQYLPEPPKE